MKNETLKKKKKHKYMLYCTPKTQSCKEKNAVNHPFKTDKHNYINMLCC